MVGWRLLSGKEHEIRFKVCIVLCKNIVPETEKLKRRAYFRVSQEVFSLGVSPRFVADVWQKHKGDILDPLNKDLYMVVKRNRDLAVFERFQFSSEQGTPARLFFIIIFLIVVSPLPLLIARCCPSRPFLIATPSRRCAAAAAVHRSCPSRRRPFAAVLSRRRLLSYRVAFVHRERVTAVHIASTANTTGDHQNAAVALLDLFQESTAEDELIVGLDSLFIGDTDDNSMEDQLADGNATDGDVSDGDMEDGEATMNGLRQMGQRLQFDILELFFDDFACDIE